MKPSLPTPEYANAYVSESTCTRELFSPLFTSCSKLFPSDWVFTAVISPAAANALGIITPNIPSAKIERSKNFNDYKIKVLEIRFFYSFKL